MKKVCYGLAIPGLLVSTVLYSHVRQPMLCHWPRLTPVPGQVHLRASPARFRAPVAQHRQALGRLALVGHRLRSVLLRRRLCHPRLQRPCLAYRRLGRHPRLHSADGESGLVPKCKRDADLQGAMWLYDNWSRPNRNLSWKLLAAWNILIIIVGFFLMGVGTYGSVKDIIDAYNASGGSAAWSCADNSNSVPSS